MLALTAYSILPVRRPAIFRDVSSRNFGIYPGLLAAAALLIDDVLVVAMGISSGFGAIGSVLVILSLSANTAFADFPLLCRSVTQDNFPPHGYGYRGRRLVYSDGVFMLAALRRFGGRVEPTVSKKPFVAVLRNGELLPDVKEVISVIARNGLVLASGRIAPGEALMILREGRTQGVKHIIATHAMDLAGKMNRDQILEPAKFGAIIEFDYRNIPSEDGHRADAIGKIVPERWLISELRTKKRRRSMRSRTALAHLRRPWAPEALPTASLTSCSKRIRQDC